MNNIEEQIFDIYAMDCSVAGMSYTLLGKMLNEKFVAERLKLFGINKMYLYAGTYMAVQLYRVGKKYITINGIVDKNGKIPFDDDIPVLTLDEWKKQYNEEKVVITSVRYYKEIKKELEQFIDSKNIIYIGELLLGII